MLKVKLLQTHITTLSIPLRVKRLTIIPMRKGDTILKV